MDFRTCLEPHAIATGEGGTVGREPRAGRFREARSKHHLQAQEVPWVFVASFSLPSLLWLRRVGAGLTVG